MADQTAQSEASASAGEGVRQLRCEVYTPTGTVFTGNVREVIAPGTMGELGILPLHAPLMTPMRIGELRLMTEEHTEILYAVGGGFLEVRDDRVTVLAPTCEPASDIDTERAESAKSTAERFLTEGDSEDGDFDRAQKDLDRALNRIGVAKRK